MRKLQCEVCGSPDVVKVADNMFQCQYCGCKYTLEQVRTIVFSGEVTTKASDFEIVGGKLVKYNGADTVVAIPDTITVIGNGAFENCSGITEVTIPSGVKLIEAKAFSGCTFLRTVSIPNTVTVIGPECFKNCTSLGNIVIPDSVKILGHDNPDYRYRDRESVFRGCTSLKKVQLSRNIKYIGQWTFYGCTALKEIVIPEGVETIHWDAFEDCTNLEKITLPTSLAEFYDSSTPRRGGFSKNLAIVEGNSKVLLDALGIRPDKLLADEWSWCPVFAQKYVEQLLTERRIKKKCPNCGGNLYRFLNKTECTKCRRVY